MKKLFLIVAVLLVLGGGGYYAWLLTTGKLTPNVEVPVPGTEPQPLPVETIPPTTATTSPVITTEPAPVVETPGAPLAAITTEPIVDFWINTLDAQLYYVTSEGVIGQVAGDGAGQTVTSSHFDGGVHRVIPSPHGDMVLIESGLPGNPGFKLFDVERHLWRALPAGTTAASWNPTGPTTNIVFLHTKPGQAAQDAPVITLNDYNVSKATSKTITSLAYSGTEMTWETPEVVYLGQKPSRTVESELWAFNLKKRTLTQVIAPKRGLWINWQPNDGGIALDNTQGAYLITTAGALQARIPFSTTPTKCIIERPAVYCGAIVDGVSAKQLPDNYLQRAVMSSDNIVTLSLADLPVVKPATTLLDAKAQNVSLDIWHLRKQGDTLFFINRYDNRLYRYSL